MTEIAEVPFSVQERDVDLLILEQLHVSPAFVARLAERDGVRGPIFYAARHSVYRGNGETDVLVFLDGSKGRIAVMIENKIGAMMQPQQCERYHLRGQVLVEAAEAVAYTTVLCAPRAYLATVPATELWNHRLAHEDIAEWMKGDPSPSAAWRRVHEHGRELHLRMATEIMDPGVPLAEQPEAVRQALDAITQLAAVARSFAGRTAND
ncbi:MAG TPA: hypothetical protein VGO22_16815 [Pseudorhizobium sp.]|jgi:hypothetical protein|nr:hypothetical protein [Pseudorhizobium sp.]